MGSLSKDVFKEHTLTNSRLFAGILGLWFCPNFWLIVRQLTNTFGTVNGYNVIKRKKAPLMIKCVA